MARPKDTKPPVEYPLTADDRAAHYAAAREIFESLVNFQWAAPAKLAEYQAGHVKALVAHAVASVPFYAERLAMLSDGAGSVSLEKWLDVPVLKRSDLVNEAASLKSLNVPEEHGKSRPSRSSGTTGGQVEVLRTELQDSIDASIQFRFWQDCGLDYANNLGIVRAVDPNAPANPRSADASEISKWGPPWLPFRARGNRELLSVHNPPARQLSWLNDRAPAYLHTMASNISHLVRHVRATGCPVPDLRGAITGGEMLSADVRRQAKTWLNLDIFDALASAECGLIATQCPATIGQPGGGAYHIEAETVVVEVLKQDGTPCGPGETGLLTVTPTHGFAMPLIRYQSDDWVTVGGVCNCGRSRPILSDIVGRDSSLLQFADGTRQRLDLDSDVVFEHLGPRRWQIVQTACDRVAVRVADMRVDQPANLNAMEAYIKGLVERDVLVESTFVPVLGAEASGKFALVVRAFT